LLKYLKITICKNLIENPTNCNSLNFNFRLKNIRILQLFLSITICSNLSYSLYLELYNFNFHLKNIRILQLFLSITICSNLSYPVYLQAKILKILQLFLKITICKNLIQNPTNCNSFRGSLLQIVIFQFSFEKHKDFTAIFERYNL